MLFFEIIKILCSVCFYFYLMILKSNIKIEILLFFILCILENWRKKDYLRKKSFKKRKFWERNLQVAGLHNIIIFRFLLFSWKKKRNFFKIEIFQLYLLYYYSNINTHTSMHVPIWIININWSKIYNFNIHYSSKNFYNSVILWNWSWRNLFIK